MSDELLTERAKELLRDLVEFTEKGPAEVIEEALHYLNCCYAGTDPNPDAGEGETRVSFM